MSYYKVTLRTNFSRKPIIMAILYLKLNNAHKARHFHTSCEYQKNLLYGSKPSTSDSNIIGGKDPYTIATALSLSVKTQSCVLGAQIHGNIIKFGFSNDTFSLNNLIRMYMKCGVLAEGFKLFEEMPQRNLVSWTLVISGATEDGEFVLGLEVFLDMIRNGLRPNEFTFGSVMKACGDAKAYEFVLGVHCMACKIGMEQNLFVGGSILNMYFRFGDIESAEMVFAHMEKIDVCCWNAMIGGYAQCGSAFKSLDVVSLMHCRGVTMDQFTFINALKGCSLIRDLDFGEQLHGLIIQSGLKSIVPVMNALLHMYFVNGQKNYALRILNSMQRRDIISWNIAFGGFSQEMDVKEIASLFRELMLEGIKPNHTTFSVLFRKCGELLNLKLALQFCSVALRIGFFHESSVTCSLINMFAQFGSIEMSCLVFDNINFKPVFAWNELISAYNLNFSYKEAMKTFSNLWGLGVERNEYTFSITLEACFKSDNKEMGRLVHGAAVKSGFDSHGYICSPLIKLYVKSGGLDDSFEFFKGMKRLDSAFCGVMISTLVHHDHTCEAFRFLKILIEYGEMLDEFIFGSILNGCSCIAAYQQTQLIHSLVTKMGFDMHAYVTSALIDAYSKCGDIKSAQIAFEQSIKKSKDVIIYNSMIIAYAHHGLAWEAIRIFEKMKIANVKPSQSTFVSLISACSHIGLVEQGCFFFQAMKSEYGMEPSRDNFGCLVDMLSRNGYLYDAREIIESMHVHPWPAILRSLLSGCRIHGNRELGEWATTKLLQLVPKNDAAYILLSNSYSEAGIWEDAIKMRKDMIDKGVSKSPGHSRIEIS